MSRAERAGAGAVMGRAVILFVAVATLVATLAGPSQATTAPTPEGTTRVGPLPPGLRGARPMLWTGSEVVLINPNSTRPGAAFNPVKEQWRQVPPLPYGEPLVDVDGVWTGSRVVVGGIRCRDVAPPDDEAASCQPGSFGAAAWDPRRSSWRRLKGPPGLELLPGNDGVWGRAIGAVDKDVVFTIEGQLWSLDTEGFTWTRLLDGPDPYGVSMCAVGDRLVHLKTSWVDGQVAQAWVLDRGALEWRSTDMLTVDQPVLPVDAVCAEDFVLARTNVLQGLWRFDPVTLVWSQLPDPPGELSAGATFHAAVWTGRELLFADDYGERTSLALDPASMVWRSIEPPPFGSCVERNRCVAWSDGVGYLVDYPTNRRRPVGLASYRPA